MLKNLFDKDKQKVTEELNSSSEIASAEDYGSAVPLQSEDMNKWEMEVNAVHDEFYHTLLGEGKVNGVWKRVDYLPKRINELGASFILSELKIRVNINMQMSELNEQEIRHICADTGDAVGDLLEDNWEKWEIPSESLESNMHSICLMVFHHLYIMLNLSKNAGMRKHREKRGSYVSQEPVMERGEVI